MRKRREYDKMSVYLVFNELIKELYFPKILIPKIKEIVNKGLEIYSVSLHTMTITKKDFSLFITTDPDLSQETLSKFMQWITSSIAVAVNRFFSRDGSAFKRRFKSKIIRIVEVFKKEFKNIEALGRQSLVFVGQKCGQIIRKLSGVYIHHRKSQIIKSSIKEKRSGIP